MAGMICTRFAAAALSDSRSPRGEPYQHRLNLAGKVLDFGDVRTDGSVLVRRENGEWVLRALPRTRDFFVELNTVRPVGNKIEPAAVSLKISGFKTGVCSDGLV
jgi:hypothetical protein